MGLVDFMGRALQVSAGLRHLSRSLLFEVLSRGKTKYQKLGKQLNGLANRSRFKR